MDTNTDKNGSTRYLSDKELRALLEQPSLRSLTGLRNRCTMQLMAESGLRIGEALALKPKDISLGDKRVEVLRGKGNKPRTCYWRTDELTIFLERWKERRPSEAATLFCTIKGAHKCQALAPHSFRCTFRSYAEAAGLNPSEVTPHTLRHTFGTDLLRRCHNIRVVQKALGHAWVTTTQLYTHVDEDEVAHAIRGY
ncbi:MAG: tyrosine-type recombinase/integrase [Chloroflexi bacterium]|nr:tyrosine-type recombinase/integrase [Chloroflexota bacterium]